MTVDSEKIVRQIHDGIIMWFRSNKTLALAL